MKILKHLTICSVLLVACGQVDKNSQLNDDASISGKEDSKTVEISDDTRLLGLAGVLYVEVARSFSITRKVLYVQDGNLLTWPDLNQPYCAIDTWGKGDFPKGTLEGVVFGKMFDENIRVGLNGTRSNLVSIACSKGIGNGSTKDLTYKEFKEATDGLLHIVRLEK